MTMMHSDGRITARRGKSALMAILLAGVSIPAIALSTSARAASEADAGTSVSDAPSIESVVVTARRKAENVQNVPQTDIPVTAEALRDANILNFKDLATVVPGIQLNESNNGVLHGITMRGLSYQPTAATTNSVGFYLDDAPTNILNAYESLYDIAQIEVLEGPQGTLRGVPAPSGAITFVTHKPDLEEYGGYIDVTASTIDSLNANGAINVPIIEGVLGLRVAGVAESNDVDGVKSYSNPKSPFSHTTSERVSLLFQPNDKFSASVMYQDLRQDRLSYLQVIGPGYAGSAFAPANYNGPAISLDQRRSVGDPTTASQVMQTMTWNASYQFTDNTSLTYEGSYTKDDASFGAPGDPGNYFPGNNWYQLNSLSTESWTHELRLQARLTDYLDSTAGVFYGHTTQNETTVQPEFLGPPTDALGNPISPLAGSPSIFPLVVSSVFPTSVVAPYAGLDLHLGDTEITGSARYLMNDLHENVSFSPAVLSPADVRGRNDDWIYNASVSHKFTDDIMAYFTTGTSWRPNVPTSNFFTIGPQNAEGDPYFNSALNPQPEHSTSYELGAKTTWFEKRLLVNVSAFRQTFTNLGISPLPFYYLGVSPFAPLVPAVQQITLQSAYLTADAVSQGIDAQVQAQLTDHWNFQVSGEYSHGHVSGTNLPCSPPGYRGAGAGVPPVSAFGTPGNYTYVYLCPSNASIAAAPDWSLTLQSEYDVPLTDAFSGYVRAIGNIYAKNPYTDTVYSVPSYGLLSLYLGVRATDDSWQAMIFAKNLTNTRLATSETRSADVGASASTAYNAYGPAGYNAVQSMTPRQEFGINLTYNFGSK